MAAPTIVVACLLVQALATLMLAVPAPARACATPAGIPGDGSVNVTRQLQRLINSVPNGGCIEFPRRSNGRPMRYRVEGALRLRKRVNVTIDGHGAVLFATRHGPLNNKTRTRGQRAHIEVIGGANITIRNLVIDGPNRRWRYHAIYEEESGIRLSGVQGAVLHRIRIREVYGDAVSIYAGAPVPREGKIPSRNILISRLRAERIGRQGIAITGGEWITITDSVLRRVRRTVFDLEPIPSTWVAHVRIMGNRIGFYRHTLLGGGGSGWKDDIYFAYNKSTRLPIYIKFIGTNLTIEGNVGVGLAHRPMVNVRFGDNITVQRNIQAFASDVVRCPPNCREPAVFLGEEGEAACHAYAAENRFVGALSIFGGTTPSPPCAWVDGGNYLGD